MISKLVYTFKYSTNEDVTVNVIHGSVKLPSILTLLTSINPIQQLLYNKTVQC